MAKLTLLDMVQTILSSMDSDDVNTISDTEESLQVVDIIEDTYFEMMSQRDWAHLKGTCKLESLGDTTQPTTLKIPELVSSINVLKYETTDAGATDKTYAEIVYCNPVKFLDDLLQRNTSDVTVDEVTNPDGAPLWIFNNRSPKIWTSFDDENIVMDAYVKDIENTLQGAKSVVHCVKTPVFDKTDTAIADMPEKAFPTYLAECKRACHLYLKQVDSVLDAKRALRGQNRLKDKDWRAHDRKKTPNFGRR